MSYNEQKAKMGRTPVYVLEMDLDVCENTFSVAPCTAVLSTPGAQCYNMLNTCQDKGNYGRTTRTFRFATQAIDGLQIDGEIPCFPVLQDSSIDFGPTVLAPGKGLGVRSVVNCTLSDFPWSDIVTDPYASSRQYDPNTQGTFFGKLVARQQYYEGRPMRVKQGYLTDAGQYDEDNMMTRTYFIDQFKGPGANAQFTVTGRDPLRFSDASRAQMPSATKATLVSSMTDTSVAFFINDPDDIIYDAFTAGQEYIMIGDEIMKILSASTALEVMTVTVGRGASGIPSIYSTPSEQEEHDADDSVQSCYYFSDMNASDLTYYLLNTVAGIDSSFLDKTNWDYLVNTWTLDYKFDFLLVEPTGVKSLLEQITEHGYMLWWDEREALVKMSFIVLRDYAGGPYNDTENIVAGSVSRTINGKGRITSAVINYGLRNPTLDGDKQSEYQRTIEERNVDATFEDQYGDPPKIKTIFSKIMQSTKTIAANDITENLLNVYLDSKIIIKFRMTPKDDDIWTGDAIIVNTQFNQDSTGATYDQTFRVLQADEILTESGPIYEYTCQSEDTIQRFCIIAPDEDPDNPGQPFPTYENATPEQRATYCFISPEEGFSDGSPPYTIA